MLWAHQDPKCTLVSTVGVWHLTLCRASFWTMQTASKELNLQGKQSVAAKITPHNKINVEPTYPWGGHTAWWITLGYRTFFFFFSFFCNINTNKLIVTSRWGNMRSTENRLTYTENKQEAVIVVMELGCPWGIFQSYLDVCQCSLLLLWNISKRGAIQQKENCLRSRECKSFLMPLIPV